MANKDIAAEKKAVTGNIENDISKMKTLFHFPANSDLICREDDSLGFKISIVFIDGMVNTMLLDDFVLRAIRQADKTAISNNRLSFLIKRALQTAQASPESSFSKIADGITAGMTALFCENVNTAILIDLRGYETRKVTQANNESVISGSQEGFVENLRTNITLVRRYCQTKDLVTEMISVGTQQPLRAALLYVDGVTNESALNIARQRLSAINKASVHGIGQIQQLIEDRPMALLPQMLMTERPDRAAAALSDGQFVILADCSPYALVAPCTIFTLMQASDDAFARWQYGTYTRIIRFIGMLLALLLPGLYVALITYHTQLIPLSLLSSIAETRVNVPFPVLFEVILMELAFFMINEANLRIPSQVGMSISIIGGLILGQAAVQASIISPILIIIIALSGLGCYCMPDYGMTVSLIIYRLLFEISGAVFGLFGICMTLIAVLCQACAMTSFGCSFLSPLAPYRPHNPDLLFRFPIFMQKRPLFYSKRECKNGDVES